MTESLSDGPDYDGLEDEAFPPLPPPNSPGKGEGLDQESPFEDAVEDGEVSKLADVPAAKRKGVKRPQPKLDSHRLTSERGLPALRTLFDNVHFKGKGHEAEDLQLLLHRMENWAHRLFPKLQFEDFIEKLEKLGNKKEVQTCLKRIRLDMPLTHEDFMDKDGETEAPEQQVFQDFDPFGSESSIDDSRGPIQSTPAPSAPTPPALTEEQLRRMQLNRQRALERRIACQQPTEPPDSQSVTLSGNGPSSSSTDQERLEDLDLDGSCSTQPPVHLLHTDPELLVEPPAPCLTDPEPSACLTDPEPLAPHPTDPEPSVDPSACLTDPEPSVDPSAPHLADPEPSSDSMGPKPERSSLTNEHEEEE